MLEDDKKYPSWIEQNIIAVAPELMGTTLFKFKVKLQVLEASENSEKKQKEIEINLLPDLDLDYEVLEQLMQDIPSQYAFWAAVYSEVRMGVAVAERKLKMRYGQAIEKINKEYEDRKFKPSVEMMKKIVEKDEALAKADMEYQRSQMQAGKLYHMLEALKMKAELARSLAGFKRNEQERG
jgi:hypothetical protein